MDEQNKYNVNGVHGLAHYVTTTTTTSFCKKRINTRMHSSRMCTGRSLTVCQSLLLEGCLLSWGGICSMGGVCFLGGVCLLEGVSASWGCLLLGGVSASGVCGIPTCTEADTHPLWTESQTPVKTLPWPQFRCGW